MAQVSEKIRMHIGEGELSDAIDTLNNYLKTIGGDLYNQAIQLKGRYKEYARSRDMGMGNNTEEKSKISMAVLNLASEIENQKIERTPTVQEFESQRPNYQQINQQKQQLPNHNYPPNPNQYIAQCMFTMDSMAYYLTQSGHIYMVNPMSNQTMPVGMKMPSQNPMYAWTLYFTTTNIYYLVDHAGIIWGQNYGMPAQVGTVKYF